MLKFIPLLILFLGLLFIVTQKTCKSPFTNPINSSTCHPTPRWQVLLSESLWHSTCAPLYLTCQADIIVDCSNDWFCSYACRPEIICPHDY